MAKKGKKQKNSYPLAAAKAAKNPLPWVSPRCGDTVKDKKFMYGFRQFKIIASLCGGRVPLASPTPPIGTAYRLTSQPVTALESRGRRFALTRSKECAARIFIKRVRYYISAIFH